MDIFWHSVSCSTLGFEKVWKLDFCYHSSCHSEHKESNEFCCIWSCFHRFLNLQQPIDRLYLFRTLADDQRQVAHGSYITLITLLMHLFSGGPFLYSISLVVVNISSTNGRSELSKGAANQISFDLIIQRISSVAGPVLFS